MGDFLCFTIFGSGVVFLTLLTILFFSLIVSDRVGNGYYATLSVLVFVGIMYFWGNGGDVILQYVTFKYVGMYLFAGFLFSLLRTFFKGKELTKEEKKYFKLKDNVFRWWFLFPISAINWVCGHLLTDLYSFIYSKVGKVYESIFNM